MCLRSHFRRTFQKLIVSVAQLTGSITQLSGSVTQLSGSITQLSGSIKQLSGSVTQLSGSVTQLCGSVTQLSGSVTQLSGSVTLLIGLVTQLSAALLMAVWLAAVSILTRPWAVGGVGLSFTVQLSQKSFDGEQEKMWAGSPVACAGQCRLNPECGAFAFNATEVPNCVLFVRLTYYSPSLPGIYYRGMFPAATASSVCLLLPTTFLSESNGSLAACKAIGLRLVQVPTVLKDLVVVQSQGLFCYDLKRTSETAPFTTMTGGPVNASLIVIQDTMNTAVTPQCIASHYWYLFREGCSDYILGSYATVCQYTPASP
ncbi:hypothetical protein HAZT_HAZT009995 [Hyalella azteca]|uniref:Apple domain-containing protein n=1 Tax=Hyalella azteca TaxID=294128 RepID=A0A6A0H569_HYAAZ|nr:hypothetical protein HAZT_HAZT009995 [Hyalella azteca]